MVKKLFFLLLLLIAFPALICAQSMTDDQVIEYVKNAQAAGKSQKQMISELGARGVTRAQAERIKKRFEEQQGSEDVGATGRVGSQERQRRSTNADTQMEAGEMDLIATELSDPTEVSTGTAARLVYGRNVFNSRNLTFAPSQNLATPANYKLGPGDEVIIDIWGTNQTTIRQTISPDGYININDIGPVSLVGQTIKEVENYLRQKLNKIYSGIDSDDPTSDIKVTLGQIRTIQINVMGEVAVPGTYQLSSFSTVFHALYRAGGIGRLGSLRNIYLMRNGRRVATFDVYDFLLKGKSLDDIRLQEGDVIMVPPFDMLVDISGNVKRPMYYEMKNGETVKNLIDYAGYFTGDAYTGNVRMVRQNGKEYQVYTIDDTDYSVFKLMDGDVVTVSAMLDRFENRIEVKGAVYRPGVYQFGGKLNTVRQLVEKADGLMADAFTNRAMLHRQHEDLTREVIPVDIRGVMDGTLPDIALQRNDVLFIPSIHDLEDIGSFTIHGEVARPGSYPYAEHTTLEDLIIQAGGLRESASTVRVDISRRLKDSKSTKSSSIVGETYQFAIKDGFVIDGTPGFELEPYDQVMVRRSPGYQAQINVSVSGEIEFDGAYTLTQRVEHLSDLVKKAGGLTDFAYAEGARLSRVINAEERRRMTDVLRMARTGQDSIDVSRLDLGSVYYVGIDLKKAIENPGCDADVVLREGDHLVVPTYNNTIRISGAVMYPNSVSYQSGKKLKYYINQAGGYGDRAKKRRAYVIYMNGQVKRLKSKNAGGITPGSEIVIPVKEKSSWKLQNTLAIATTSASLATMIATIANILK
jgi:protein involved in polysaccharide export with SLBB domain